MYAPPSSRPPCACSRSFRRSASCSDASSAAADVAATDVMVPRRLRLRLEGCPLRWGVGLRAGCRRAWSEAFLQEGSATCRASHGHLAARQGEKDCLFGQITRRKSY